MQSKICSETADKTMPENEESGESSGKCEERYTPRPSESAENPDASVTPESAAALQAPCPADEGTLEVPPSSELVLNGFPFLKAGERPFSQRGRLIVSNIPPESSEEDLRRFFVKFGRLCAVYVDSDKREGFVSLESSVLAEIARTELDGTCWVLPTPSNPSTPPPDPSAPSADPTTSTGAASEEETSPTDNEITDIAAAAAAEAAAGEPEAADAAAEATSDTAEAAAGSDGPAGEEAGDAAEGESEADKTESVKEEEEAMVEGVDSRSETQDDVPQNDDKGGANGGEEEEEAKETAEPQGPRVRVRRARHSAALSVGNLSPCVSNELLAEAFGRFGEVERSIVAVEASGSTSGGSRASGRGRLEFTSAEQASQAVEACRDGVFLLTACLRPVMVEPFKQLDEEEGVPEASLPRGLHYYKERSKGPRFATPGTLEFEFAARCRALDEMERLHVQQVERGVQRARERLEAEMEAAYHDRVRRREEMRRLDEERRRHMDAQRAAYSSDAQHQVADERPGTELEAEGANSYSSPRPYKSEPSHSARTMPITAQTQHAAQQQHAQLAQQYTQHAAQQHAAQQHAAQQHVAQHREYAELPAQQQNVQHAAHGSPAERISRGSNPHRTAPVERAPHHGSRAARAQQHSAHAQHAEHPHLAQHPQQSQNVQHAEQAQHSQCAEQAQHIQHAQHTQQSQHTHQSQQSQHAQHAQHAQHRGDSELPSSHQLRSDLGQLLLMTPEQRRHGGHGGASTGVGDDRLWAGIPESMALAGFAQTSAVALGVAGLMSLSQYNPYQEAGPAAAMDGQGPGMSAQAQDTSMSRYTGLGQGQGPAMSMAPPVEYMPPNNEYETEIKRRRF